MKTRFILSLALLNCIGLLQAQPAPSQQPTIMDVFRITPDSTPDMLIVNAAWRLNEASVARQLGFNRGAPPKIIFAKPGLFVTPNESYGQAVEGWLSSNSYRSGRFGSPAMGSSSIPTALIKPSFQHPNGMVNFDPLSRHLLSQIKTLDDAKSDNHAFSVSNTQCYVRNHTGRMLPDSVASPGSWASVNLRWRLRMECSTRTGETLTPTSRFESPRPRLVIHSFLILESPEPGKPETRVGPLFETRLTTQAGEKVQRFPRPSLQSVERRQEGDVVKQFDATKMLNQIAVKSPLFRTVSKIHWQAVRDLYNDDAEYINDLQHFAE